MGCVRAGRSLRQSREIFASEQRDLCVGAEGSLLRSRKTGGDCMAFLFWKIMFSARSLDGALCFVFVEGINVD